MSGQVCGKCGQVIKSGQLIIYVGGVPQHDVCPRKGSFSEGQEKKEVPEWFKKRVEELRREALKRKSEIEADLKIIEKFILQEEANARDYEWASKELKSPQAKATAEKYARTEGTHALMWTAHIMLLKRELEEIEEE